MTRQEPFSGYAIERIYTTQQELRPKAAGEPHEHDGLRFGWDWRWTGERLFDVRITVEIEPSPGRPYFVAVDVVGQFRQVDATPAVSIEEFVKLQAVAILMPYARQFVSNLTGTTASGAFYLPPMSVVSLMKPFEHVKTTAERQKARPLGTAAQSPAPAVAKSQRMTSDRPRAIGGSKKR